LSIRAFGEYSMMEGMKSRNLSLEQTLSVPCPTCSAQIGERCELAAGGVRVEPHRDRKLAAADAFDKKASIDV
jgi:hypothetical protein